MNSETVLKPKGDYISRRIGEETILVPVRSGVAELDSVFTLNEVGATIWAGMTSGLTVGDIIASVAENFDVDTTRADRDVHEFLHMLIDHDLVRHETR